MRLKASVTIFLSLVITVVIVVVCTVIESARISVSQMEGKAATYMAVESVLQDMENSYIRIMEYYLHGNRSR